MSPSSYHDEKDAFRVTEDEAPPAYSGRYYTDKYSTQPALLRSVSGTVLQIENRQRHRQTLRRILLVTAVIAAALFLGFSSINNLDQEASSILRSFFGPDHIPGRQSSHKHHTNKASTYHTCPATPDFLSCHLPGAPTNSVDTCCVNAPGGQLLLAQFWDFAPAVGPSDKWTLHGLWPDNCDGSYEQFCDSTRIVNSIETIFQTAGATELLTSMRETWKSNSGNDDSLWTHEWNKHGTCISTIAPKCYGPEENVTAPMVEYFARAVDLHMTLDTFSALADAGIVPAWDLKFNKTDIIDAIRSVSDGHNVTLGCTRSGVLSEVWYHFNVKGRAQDGEYIFTEPDGIKDSCPETGIKYFPKVYRHRKPVSPPPSTPGSEPFIGKGYVIINDGSQGCIISGGEWYSSGTCATIRGSVSEFGGVELRSSRGPCAVSEKGRLVCGHGVQPAQFTVGEDGELLYGGIATWGAYQRATGWLKEGLWNGKWAEQLQLPVEVKLFWRAL
ncbi:ribonuclease T2-like protein [Lipomyces kononenkoae]|uniref:Ribonuclease T2-like protein n=1 Tax=Lipomyces kononenkoae TaxID=34357 RepID=A0ACC3SZX2_LIPKO